MNGTLKEVRINALQFSEKEMATMLEISISTYRELEKKQDLNLDLLSRVAKASGKTIDYLVNAQKEKVIFNIDNSWLSIDELKSNLFSFLDSELLDVEERDTKLRDEIANIKDIVNKMSRKPRVALVGRSDVGKSTLINTLIGSPTLPEAWTPTTSIIIYVKHIKDRPAFCSSNVMVFKSDQDNNLWDDTRVNDEEYTQSLCIVQGDYDLLQEHGARQGSQFEQTDATSAVVFVESDILHNCDLLDLPGYGTDREEDDSFLRKVKDVEVLIYLSLANGFMREEDIKWLQGELPNLSSMTLNHKNMKPLANLYIVASQAHIVSNGSKVALKEILDKGVERFEKTLSDNYWNNIGQDVSEGDFRNRFFTYSTDQECLRSGFEKDLRELLERLPQIMKENIVTFLKDKFKTSLVEIENRLCSFRESMFQKEKKRENLEKLKASEPERIRQNSKNKKELCDKIREYGNQATLDFTTEYNKQITQDEIIKLIEKNKWSKKEDDLKALSLKLSNLLNDSYSRIIRMYSEQLKKRIDKYIYDFEDSTLGAIDNSVGVSLGFNFKGAFAGGLTGLATYGGLALWASSLGNLGAYILLAKGVSLLSALGISVGGTAAASAAVAAIGGPIVITIGIAALLGIFVYQLFSGGWKTKVAKKVIEQYDKHKVLAGYKENIFRFWSDTERAFLKAAEHLEEEYERYLQNLEDEINSDDSELNSWIEFEERRKSFFQKLINQKF